MKKLALAIALLVSYAAPAQALTADEMREISRANIQLREARETAEANGIVFDTTSRLSAEEIHEAVALSEEIEGLAASTRARVSCQRIGTIYTYYSTSRAIYLMVDGNAYQVLPENEGILQEGPDVVFTGITYGDHTRGAFRIPNAIVSEVMKIYLDCRY